MEVRDASRQHFGGGGLVNSFHHNGTFTPDGSGARADYYSGGSDVIIRQANEDEAQQLAEVIAASFIDVAKRFDITRETCPSHTSFITTNAISTGMSLGSTFYLAVEGESICGCVGLRQPKDGGCIIEKLAVLPAFRRHGVGHALMEHAFAEIRRVGAARADIGIIEEHSELRAWYEKLGFRAVRSARYEHLPFGVLHMQKSLEPGACDQG